MIKPVKKYLPMNVLEAAQERIALVFDEFEKINLSFSGGKDSSVMFHLVMEEAVKRNRKITVFFLDWEIQFQMTITHIEEMIEKYKDHIDMHWVCLPIVTNNAASMLEPEWTAWEPGKLHVRTPPEIAITDKNFFSFFKADAMTFEEFVPTYGKWFANGEKCACFIGIRTGESLNRWRSIAHKTKEKCNGWQWTTKLADDCWNVYPIYDWKTEDIWSYNGTLKKSYNRLYTMMHQAGIPIHNQRICEYFSEQSKHSLNLFHAIEPQMWGKILGRINGANIAAMTSNERGGFTGEGQITKPDHHTWRSYVDMLLDSMPEKTSEHYRDKFTVWIKYYINKKREKLYRADNNIPADVKPKTEVYENLYPEVTIDTEIHDFLEGDLSSEDKPSWRRLCRVILRGDYWCSNLSFSPNKTSGAENYKKLMADRRAKWNIYSDIK